MQMGNWKLFGRAAVCVFAGVIFFSTVLSAATRIDDPKSFVTDVYRRFAQKSSNIYEPPEGIYTARLAKLISEDRRKSKGEVGCLDFVFWVNGQDWEISNVAITSTDAGQDRQTIIAKFKNLGTLEEIHFDFRREAGRWLLDEVHSVLAEKWTLSDVLKCAP